MELQLGHERLRDGQEVELLLIRPPAGGWKDRIAPFLAHKGQPWTWQIEQHLEAPADQLESRFYVATCGQRLISHIMTAEFAGVGILGHVFTEPQWRGLGAASILMRTVCEDFRRRDGIVMHLGTEYQSNAWRIYRRFGFEGICPPGGLMRLALQPRRYDQLYAPGPTEVRPVCWQDWPMLQALMLRPEGDWLRSRALRAFGVADVEQSFLELMQQIAAGSASAWVMVGPSGAAVGLLSLAACGDLPAPAGQLDLYAHPDFADQLGGLVGRAALPDDWPLLCWLDGASGRREAALVDAGLRVGCRLEGFCRSQRGLVDLVLLWRGRSVRSRP